MITPARLSSFLRIIQEQSPEQWEVGSNDQNGTSYWYATYLKSLPHFLFLIEFNDEMIYIQYRFRDLKIKSGCWLSLYRVLLRLNEEVSLVKFGLAFDGTPTLLGELPAMNISLDLFQNLLDLMVYYLKNLYWEINLVAENATLADYLTSGEMIQTILGGKKQELARMVKREGFTSQGR